jgi:thiol-disulfide isomerase/thioredoxin
LKPLVLTNRNFNLRLGKPGLLFVYANYCIHCVQFKPEFQKLADLFTENGDFIIAEIESEQINTQVTNVIGNVEGYPTLLFFNSNGQIVQNYQGDRTVQALLKNICKIYKVCKK